MQGRLWKLKQENLLSLPKIPCVEKIYESCKADLLPEPEYTVHPRDIMIKFTAPEDRIISTGKSRVNDRVNDSEREILNLLYEDPAYTYAEIAIRSNISRKTVAMRMKTLQEKGIVERIGTNKKGYWKITEGGVEVNQ